MTRILGKDLRALTTDYSIEWGFAYPIINDAFEVIGIVDSNCPRDFNDGNWRVVEFTVRVGDANIITCYAEAVGTGEEGED